MVGHFVCTERDWKFFGVNYYVGGVGLGTFLWSEGWAICGYRLLYRLRGAWALSGCREDGQFVCAYFYMI